jgi:hypothetical protein
MAAAVQQRVPGRVTPLGDAEVLAEALHEQAGSRRLVQVHGRADRLRCSRHGCVHGAPAGLLPDAAALLAPFTADPRHEAVTVLRSSAEELLPAACGRLGILLPA